MNELHVISKKQWFILIHVLNPCHCRKYWCHLENLKHAQKVCIFCHLKKTIYIFLALISPNFLLNSYHQKYILRQHRDILDTLNLSDEEIISSPLACKLNGYLGGYGDYEDFLKVTTGLSIIFMKWKLKIYICLL